MPPALLAEWPESVKCYWNKNHHKKLTLEKKNLLGIKPATFQSEVWCSTTELSLLLSRLSFLSTLNCSHVILSSVSVSISPVCRMPASSTYLDLFLCYTWIGVCQHFTCLWNASTTYTLIQFYVIPVMSVSILPVLSVSYSASISPVTCYSSYLELFPSCIWF